MANYWINASGDNTSSSYVNKIIIDGSGDIVLFGAIGSPTAAQPMAAITKISQQGVIKTVHNLDPTINRRISTAALQSDGTYLIGAGTPAATPNAVLAKLNADFSVAASPIKRVGSSFNGQIVGIHKTTDGGFVVPIYYESNILVAKYNSSFSDTLVWSYSTTNTGILTGSYLDSSDNLYITGTATITTSKNITIKFNSSGVIQWNKTLTGSLFNRVLNYAPMKNICVDSSGGIYVGVPSSTAMDLAKYDTSGNLIFNRKFTTTSAPAVSMSTDGTDVFMAFWSSTSEFNIVSYNSSGTLLWQRKITFASGGTPRGSSGHCCLEYNSTDDSLIVVFHYQNLGSGSYTNQSVVCKLPADGTGTGTYGPFTYANGTLTESAGTLTLATEALTSGGSVTSSSATATSSIITGGNFNVS